MAGGSGLLGPRRRGGLTVQRAAATVIIVGILAGLYAFLHWVQAHLVRYPHLVLLFMPITASCMAVVIPLMVFISYQDDFKNLNPWNPLHVYAIARKCFSAMAANNMKVAEKDL